MIRFVFVKLRGKLRDTKVKVFYEPDNRVTDIIKFIKTNLGPYRTMTFPPNDTDYTQEDLTRAKEAGRFIGNKQQ